uniref:Uncharacterized protein n=1 Tax=Rhizophora mucronata TaxID=61149 RepID=A0A2P2PFR3_RHIMU
MKLPKKKIFKTKELKGSTSYKSPSIINSSLNQYQN